MNCEGCNRLNPIQKVRNIIEGYSNLIFKDGEIEILAQARLKECMGCDNKVLLVTMGEKEIFGCKGCTKIGIKCPLDAKVRAEDEVCPLNKW